jgi:hypothetical protein
MTGEASMVEVPAVLVDTQAAAVAVGVAPVTVRSWAHRGWLERKGTGSGNRAVWDLGKVYDVAAALARGETPGKVPAGPVSPDGTGPE